VPISTALMANPSCHHPLRESDWAYRRLEANARSMCEGICVWVREMTRPESERSPTVLSHEIARSQRMADFFEARVSEPLMQAEPGMAHLTVAVSLDMARKRGPGDLRTAAHNSPFGCRAFPTCLQCGQRPCRNAEMTWSLRTSRSVPGADVELSLQAPLSFVAASSSIQRGGRPHRYASSSDRGGELQRIVAVPEKAFGPAAASSWRNVSVCHRSRRVHKNRYLYCPWQQQAQ